jgi:hypothetical protein
MALGNQLPIRLQQDVDRRLEKAAIKLGTTKSALIRMLATTFVDQVVQADGSMKLPPNWRELVPNLPQSDGRSKKTAINIGDGNVIVSHGSLIKNHDPLPVSRLPSKKKSNH